MLLASVAVTALYGWTVERVAYRPLRGSFRLAPLISAIGLSIVLQNFVQVSQGARVKPVEAVVRGGVEVFREGDFAVQLSYMQMLIIGTTLAVLAAFTVARHPHAARPRHARLRAGPQDGGAARHRHRPHHLA